jgi:hypothetical protein
MMKVGGRLSFSSGTVYKKIIHANFSKIFMQAGLLAKSVLAERIRNFDVTGSATKAPRHQD